MYKIPLQIIFLLVTVLYFSFSTPIIASEETTRPTTEETEVEGTELSGIRFTVGFLANDLRDESYSEIGGKIQPSLDDTMDKYSIWPVGLAHVPLFSSPEFRGVRAGFGLSAALGLTGSSLTENLQVALGGSLLFNARKHLLALTFGGMIRPVNRIHSYKVGDDFPENVQITKPVYERGLFLAVTSNFEVPDLFGWKNRSNQEQNATNNNAVENNNNDSNQ